MAVSSKPSQTYHLPASQPRQHSQMPGGWCRQQLPQALGECHFETLCLDQDLTLVRSRYRPNRPLVEEAHSCHEGRLLVITLALQGRSGFCASDGSTLAFDAGQTTVTTFPASQGERRYEAASTVSQLRLLVGNACWKNTSGHNGPGNCWATAPCANWPGKPPRRPAAATPMPCCARPARTIPGTLNDISMPSACCPCNCRLWPPRPLPKTAA